VDNGERAGTAARTRLSTSSADLLQQPGQVYSGHHAVALDDPAGDHHGAHVLGRGLEHDRTGGIDVRVLRGGRAADENEIGLLARAENADPVTETDRFGGVDRGPAQRLQRRR
jgi:hypothetical protein